MSTATYTIMRTVIDSDNDFGPSHGDVRVGITWNYANSVVNGWVDSRLQEALDTAATRVAEDHDRQVAAGTAKTDGDLRIIIRSGSDDPVVTVAYFYAGDHDGPSDDDLMEIGKRAFRAVYRAI